MARQIDSFNIHFKFFKYSGLWADKNNQFRFYKYYSKMFVSMFSVIYCLLLTINFFFIEREIDKIVEDMILYLTMLSAASKVFTFLILHDEMGQIFSVLESDMLQPRNEIEANIISRAKIMNKFYWKGFAVTSLISHLSHIFTPLILSIIFTEVELVLPVCSYDFLPTHFKQQHIYSLYFYQAIGMHANMWFNVNIDSFFLGLMNLVIAQLDILDDKLRRITDVVEPSTAQEESNREKEQELYSKLKECLILYNEVAKLCSLIEDTFSVTLFIQFNIASYVICVCLYRLSMPLTASYFIFLSMYILVMVLQILIPCWFGHHITDKSCQLVVSIYNCEWWPRPRTFTSSVRIFMERASRPLSITGWKLFPLSLNTFTAIANSAYSFYTLLRNVRTEE